MLKSRPLLTFNKPEAFALQRPNFPDGVITRIYLVTSYFC